MTTENISKTRPVVLVDSVGTALGTSSIVDTSAWKFAQFNAMHGGTGGSRRIDVYINAGTQSGTAATTLPNPLWVGSATSDFAGLGNPVYHCGSLTDQAIVAYGTSTNSTFSLSYVLYDE